MENIRVLLVDDEEDFRKTLARRLTKRGILPEQAGSGEECLSVLERNPVDVVVLDVKMPGMNGLEVLNLIKKQHPKSEVIFLTGHASTQDGVEGIKSGAFDYLSKPIEFDHLLGKISQAYEKIRREEEKLREAQYRLKMEQQMVACERLASLGTLAAGVAHEINNPLAIIKESIGWMKQVLKRKELNEIPRREDFDFALDKVEKAIERARRITHQLLDFVRKNDSVPSELDLLTLVNEAIQLVSREAKNKDIEIAQKINRTLPSIWSDPYQLRQVLVNLLTNAIHATGPGGSITVTLMGDNEGVSLTVQDTGEGIPKENMERIFEPFFSTKAPGEGTGLGLFVTRGIIERLSGKIEVDSQLGQGTSFCIKLPKSIARTDALAKDVSSDLLERISGEKCHD
jgi:two-component system NtrC family sensor kinase